MGCQAYVTPVSAGEICVAVLSRDPRIRVNEILGQFPALSARLQGVNPITTEKGAVSGNRVLWRIYRGSVVLAGDASGTVDAITGDGLSISFRQALALSSALEAGNLSSYAVAHRRLAMRPLLVGSLLLLLDKHPRLREHALRTVAGDPGCLGCLMALHAGSRLAPRFLRQRILPLTLQLFKGPVS
jgi:flavin-dependent dehydrogenase